MKEQIAQEVEHHEKQVKIFLNYFFFKLPMSYGLETFFGAHCILILVFNFFFFVGKYFLGFIFRNLRVQFFY